MDENVVCYPRAALVAALKDLELLVVSTDRHGSHMAGLPRDEWGEEVLRFERDWQVFQRLARLRAFLYEPFSRDLGPDDMEELEREMQGLPYWTSTRQRPPEEWCIPDDARDGPPPDT